MGARKKDSSSVDEVYFIVKEDHCLGHEQQRTQTVAEYRQEQGVDLYDEMNRQWRDIILKKRSSGPTVGRPSDRSMQLFDMCSYDIDSFREFMQTPGFQQVFDIDKEQLRTMLSDEDTLLDFAMRFLKQVLFGGKTIPMRPNAREKRIRHRRKRFSESAN